MEVQGDLVAHGAGGDEERRLHAGRRRPLLFQTVDGRVLAEDVVADLGLGHGPAHLGVGAGHGVGAQVDQSMYLASPASTEPIPTRTAACRVSPFSTSMWILGSSRLSVTPAKTTARVLVSLQREAERRVELPPAVDDAGADVGGDHREPLGEQQLGAVLVEVVGLGSPACACRSPAPRGPARGAPPLDDRVLDLGRDQLDVAAERLAVGDAEVDPAGQPLARPRPGRWRGSRRCSRR